MGEKFFCDNCSEEIKNDDGYTCDPDAIYVSEEYDCYFTIKLYSKKHEYLCSGCFKKFVISAIR